MFNTISTYRKYLKRFNFTLSKEIQVDRDIKVKMYILFEEEEKKMPPNIYKNTMLLYTFPLGCHQACSQSQSDRVENGKKKIFYFYNF